MYKLRSLIGTDQSSYIWQQIMTIGMDFVTNKTELIRYNQSDTARKKSHVTIREHYSYKHDFVN
jgi:hypothetical protein